MRFFVTQKWLPAVLSGFLLTASYPPGSWDWLAWIALVPFLYAIRGAPPSLRFRRGLCFGMAHFLSLLYWIVFALAHYGNFNPVLSLGPLTLLCFYLSLYPACFAWLAGFLKEGSRFELLLMAGIWVALEFARGKLLTGFPWCLLGYTQYHRLSLIQISDLTGVYGLSFLLLLSNGLFSRILMALSPNGTRFPKWGVFGFVLLIAAILTYGHCRLAATSNAMKNGDTLRVALIQGNIDQSVKWEPAYQAKTMRTYLALTRSSLPFKPQLIVWPETSVPFFFQEDERFRPALFSTARESGAGLLFGSPAYQRVGTQLRYYNRAYLITPNSERPQYYDKVHLTPFGEYVPLKKYLFFVHRLVQAAGDFNPGKGIYPLKLGRIPFGVLICFEGVFPELARLQVRKGARVLVNITNDAWFGRTSAPFQHLSMARFRAVENGMPLLRVANSGISAIIGPRGRVFARSDLFERQCLVGVVPVPDSSGTLYTRFGDLFAYAMALSSLIPLGLAIRNTKRCGQWTSGK